MICWTFCHIQIGPIRFFAASWTWCMSGNSRHTLPPCDEPQCAEVHYLTLLLWFLRAAGSSRSLFSSQLNGSWSLMEHWDRLKKLPAEGWQDGSVRFQIWSLYDPAVVVLLIDKVSFGNGVNDIRQLHVCPVISCNPSASHINVINI